MEGRGKAASALFFSFTGDFRGLAALPGIFEYSIRHN
jgi:hypothetical protein